MATQTKADAGRYTWLAGSRSGEGDCTFLFDDDVSYGTSPPLFAAGKSATISLRADDDATPQITGTAIVKDTSFKHELDGALTITMSFKMTGAYTVIEEA